MEPILRQLLQSSDTYHQKYNSAWVAPVQNAVCARWLAGFKMAARVREELTSLRRWLLLPLPRSSCCRWLSRQSLMSQPWAGLLWKLCVLCRCWWWLHWKQSLFVRESGLKLEPGYLLVITTKAINFLLQSCPGRESQNWCVLPAEVAVQGGILSCSVFLLEMLHNEYNKSWFITMHDHIHVISCAHTRLWLHIRACWVAVKGAGLQCRRASA